MKLAAKIRMVPLQENALTARLQDKVKGTTQRLGKACRRLLLAAGRFRTTVPGHILVDDNLVAADGHE